MVESSQNMDQTKIREQIEYYMSDANLARDNFFREQIQTNKEGWVSITHFLNCNKVKNMNIKAADIATAIAGGPSEKLELSKDKKTLRRIGNPDLPEQQRKRDKKAVDKGQPNTAQPKKDKQEDEFDADGKIILVEKDFDNP